MHKKINFKNKTLFFPVWVYFLLEEESHSEQNQETSESKETIVHNEDSENKKPSDKEHAKKEKSHEEMKSPGFKARLSNIYEKDYKKLLLIPLIIFLIISGALAFKFFSTGTLIDRDVSLKGGVTITITKVDVNIAELQEYLSENFKKGDVNVRALAQAGARTGLVVDSGIQSGEDIDELLKLIQTKTGALSKEDYSIEIIGPSLGASFFNEAIFAVVLAFVFMAVTVFIYFRNFMPSLYVIMAAFADIVMAFGVVSLLGMKLSTAGIAAFLMLIGYSIDTDILLTSRVLRGKTGSVFERTLGAMKTGVIMSLTALTAVLVAYSFSQSEVIRQIMLILAIGLFFDIMNTWITNASVLRWYLEKRRG